ncbi:hypothetical protein FRB98_002163 [Tulasnella sp. 332]|nr:hypothetical protein FRB98_002163 [Tulasnella sp. 332]
MKEHTPTSTVEPAIVVSDEDSDAEGDLEHAGPGPSTAQSRTTQHLKTLGKEDPMSDDTPSLVSEHGAPSTGSTLPDGLADPWYLGHIAFEDLDLAGDWWLQDPPPRQIQKYL